MKIALPSHRGILVAVAGATSAVKAEVVDAVAKRMGPSALTIGNRACPDPELSIEALIKVDGRAAEDAITIVRMTESAAVRGSRVVITARPVIDELARYRAARKLRHEYVQHHIMRRVEDTAAWETADYDFVVWARSPFPSPPVRAFETALDSVLKDLCVPHHSVYPPLVDETIERLVASMPR
jgi:RNase P protein component